MKPIRVTALFCLWLSIVSVDLIAEEVLFDAQAYSVISGSLTTAPGAVAWDALDTAPPAFNAFYALSSATVTNGGITATMAGMLGTWTGNSAYVVSLRPLENDYFVIGSGATATMTLSGLVANAEYYILIYHGRAEPGQFRQLTISVDGQTQGIIDNQSAGGSGNVKGMFIDADGSGQIAINLTGGGAEGDFAGFSIELKTLPQPMWAGYPVSESDTIDTGEFMGLLHVGDAPWLYSESLGTWLYSEEAYFTSGGAWIYLPLR